MYKNKILVTEQSYIYGGPPAGTTSYRGDKGFKLYYNMQTATSGSC